MEQWLHKVNHRFWRQPDVQLKENCIRFVLAFKQSNRISCIKNSHLDYNRDCSRNSRPHQALLILLLGNSLTQIDTSCAFPFCWRNVSSWDGTLQDGKQLWVHQAVSHHNEPELTQAYVAIWCHRTSLVSQFETWIHMCIDGLMQERRNSIANALELHLPCINPSRWWTDNGWIS